MSETQLDEKRRMKMSIDGAENEESSSKDSLSWVKVLLMIVAVMASLFVHEVGHAIGLNLIGISATFGFAIRAAGPVITTKWAYKPETIPELAFVIIAGPGLAAIVFALLGRFWRTECYMAAIYQACYVPFELLNWILGINSGHSSSVWGIGLIVVIVPFIIGAIKVIDKIMWPE